MLIVLFVVCARRLSESSKALRGENSTVRSAWEENSHHLGRLTDDNDDIPPALARRVMHAVIKQDFTM